MRNPIFGARATLALGLGAAAMVLAGSARATTVDEIGDNGSEQMGRGGAWVARASDPLAAFYNPAGLAGQPTRLTLQGNLNLQKTCFTRVKALDDTTVDNATPGHAYPQVCSGGGAFPDPQVAFTYRVNERLGLGLAVLGPSAAGNATWPTSVDGQAAPQRYLLTGRNVLLLTPTIAAGWEPIDRLRLGLGLIWGFSTLDFSNYSFAANGDALSGGLSGNDVKGEVKAKDLFIPGVTAGVLWSPTDQLDVAGWYKFIGNINAKGNIVTTTGTGANRATGNTQLNDCGSGSAYDGVCGPNRVSVNVPIPMEAKIGFRFHIPRAGAVMDHVRDPMAQDIFDIEADLTWAHDSSFQQIGISIPPNVPVNGIPGSFLPTDADVPHNFRDVWGARFGGDYNVIADALAVRAGVSFQTAAQSSTEWQNIDFASTQEVGVAAGATYRIHLGSRALEVSAGFGHTFIASSTDNGNNPVNSGVKALSGSDCNGNGTNTNGTCTGGSYPSGSQAFRTEWPVNLGTITNTFNQINLGLAYRF